MSEQQVYETVHSANRRVEEQAREIVSLRRQVHDQANEIQALRLALAVHNRTLKREGPKVIMNEEEFKRFHGCAPEMTGGLSSEEWVRQQRDGDSPGKPEWIEKQRKEC